ncbi:hypothetical protein VTP01DRAFT_6912 [Rhizomucor pusillus]|uniref:uncharacterized protein n=1 Tax=Rhizomucor pusillus TaxID=4840 RepID=UPI00374496E3
MPALVVPSEYGYVLAAAITGGLQLTWMGLRVGKARKQAGVPYPYVYAEKAEAEKDYNKHLFNCVQRVHQNSLENFPIFAILLLTGGLRHPLVSAGAGAVYLLGRFAYAFGYYTGKPEKRARGAFAYLGMLTLLGTSISTCYNLLAA